MDILGSYGSSEIRADPTCISFYVADSAINWVLKFKVRDPYGLACNLCQNLAVYIRTPSFIGNSPAPNDRLNTAAGPASFSV